MSHKTTQKDINEVVWRACDTFRGTIDPSRYKDFILVLLFLKYVSDLVREERAAYEAKYQGDAERVRRAMARGRFLVPEGTDFASLYAARAEPDIGERINKALDALEDANRAKLEGVFRSVDFNSENDLGDTRERNARLRHLLEDFADQRLDLRPSHLASRDVLGDAYEFLVKHFAGDAGKKGGEFYTPPEVSRLLARLLEPQPGSRICDPCCGSGSLLIRTGEAVPPGTSGVRDVALFGQEPNGATWALCKMNMYLHGFDQATIERGDVIRSPKLVERDALMKFDRVVANPPFSLDKWGADAAAHDRHQRFHRGIPPKGRGDYAFISHMIEIMDPVDGRVGVVVPHGVLFRSGSEAVIRRRLIEENLLDGVVGLPANLFYGVGIPAALLFFRRDKLDDTVLFIDASGEGNFEKSKNQNRLRDEDLDRIATTWKTRSEVQKYAYLARPQEIAENSFNLNISLYVDTFEEEVPVDLQVIRNEIAQIEHDLQVTRSELAKALEELGL